MIREILVPTDTTLRLRLPEAFVGKRIEVIAFAVEEAASLPAEAASEILDAERLAAVRRIFAGVAVDLSGFRFDRDAANDFDA